MIFDKITHLSSYLGISANLDTAIRFLLETDLSALPEGKTSVDGDRVYVNVMSACARPEEELRFELHHRHMDIQIDLEGTEAIATGDRSCCTSASYNPDTDFAFADCPKTALCTIGPGNFILCMAGEPHMPGIRVTPETALKKCVVKIETNEQKEESGL